jgi:hypothetical protein
MLVDWNNIYKQQQAKDNSKQGSGTDIIMWKLKLKDVIIFKLDLDQLHLCMSFPMEKELWKNDVPRMFS